MNIWDKIFLKKGTPVKYQTGWKTGRKGDKVPRYNYGIIEQLDIEHCSIRILRQDGFNCVGWLQTGVRIDELKEWKPRKKLKS